MTAYFDSFTEHLTVFILGMCTVPVAVLVEYMPDPETLSKGFFMSLFTGTVATLVKWGWEALRRWWVKRKRHEN